MFAVGLDKNKEGVFNFDIPKPEISQEDEVLIKIIKTGIDGTDYNLLKHHLVDSPENEEFLVLGHESYGVVEEVGSKVKKFKVGDLVVPTVRRGCGICISCKNKHSDYCYTGLYKEHGIHKLHGFLTSYTKAKEQYLVSLPKNLVESAVWTEPLSVVEKAFEVMRVVQSRLPYGCEHIEHDWNTKEWGKCKKAIVIGAGPLGFLAVAYLRLSGVETYVVEIVGENNIKIKLAKEMGAKYIDGKAFSPEQVLESVGQADIVFEASGASGLALKYIPHLSRNAVYLMTGIPRKDPNEVSIDANALMRNLVRQNQVIVGSVNSNAKHFSQALITMAEVNNKFDGILKRALTHTFALKDYEKGFFLEDPDRVKISFKINEF